MSFYEEALETEGKPTAADKKLLAKKYKARGSRGMDFGDTSKAAIGRLVNGGLMQIFNRWPYFDVTDDGDEVVDRILRPKKPLKWEKRGPGIWVVETLYNFALVEKLGPNDYVWKAGRHVAPGVYEESTSGYETTERKAKAAAKRHVF